MPSSFTPGVGPNPVFTTVSSNQDAGAVSSTFSIDTFLSTFSLSADVGNMLFTGAVVANFITGTHSLTAGSSLVGIRATATNRSDGSIVRLAAYDTHIGNQTSVYGTAHTGTVGDLVGFLANTPETQAASDVVSRAIGIYIATQFGGPGVAAGFGVYQESVADTNHFGGPIDAAGGFSTRVVANAQITTNGLLVTMAGVPTITLWNTNISGTHIWNFEHTDDDFFKIINFSSGFVDRMTISPAGILKVNSGKINLAGIPTSSAGLSTGDVWSNLGILTVV